MTSPKAALTFVIITVIINMLGIGLAWPILPKLVEELTGGTVAEAAIVYGVLVTGFALMQFLFAPLLGVLSDRFGRRPIMLLSLAGLGVDYVVLAIAPDIFWVTVARLLAGMMGATIATANAFVADVTPEDKRAGAFGLIGASFGIGFVAGPLIGGVLGEIDLRLPFWFAAGLCFANLTFGYFALPESLKPEDRRNIRWREANPFGALVQITKYPAVVALMVALFLTTMSQRGLESIWVLWTGAVFDWGVRDAAWSLTYVGACMVVVQGYAVRKIIAAIGERRTIFYGYALSGLSYFLLPFVTESWMIFAGITIHILGWGSASPALQAVTSKAVPKDQQGLLQGTLSSVNNLAAIIGPLMATQIFAAFTGGSAYVIFPGAFYLVAAVLCVIAITVLIVDGMRFRARNSAR
ncbi:MAG: TCR/Tet family MFS transporter [Pseudomonadota bacterium]